MADDDFGIESLAAFLHVDPAQVLKLAERGKIPGRKVGGQWRFSAAEVHHWLEERIGLSSEDELVEMEGVLDRAASAAGEGEISISRLMPIEAIAVPLAARTRGSVITSLVDVAAQSGWLWDPAKMAEAVRRAKICSPRRSTMASPCSTRAGRSPICWSKRLSPSAARRRAFRLARRGER